MVNQNAEAFESFVVKSIKIEGNQRVSEDAVLQGIDLRPGDSVSSKTSQQIIKQLYNTGFYTDVRLEKEKNTLVVVLKERPSISKLEITGLHSKKEIEKILKDNDLAPGRFYDPNLISKVEKEITIHYLTKRRYSVKIDTKVTEVAKNKVNLEIQIFEGTVATIKEIKFVGNEVFADNILKKQMLHKTKNIFSWFTKSNHYSKEKLAADLELLRSFYLDHGYLNFQIESTQVSLSPNKEDVYLTVNLTEGEQYFFGVPVLDGELVVSREELMNIIEQEIKPGDVFSRKKVWEVKKKLEERLGEDGYSQAMVKLIDEIDEGSRRTIIKFLIDPKARIVVRKISFEGNNLTEDRVLRREIEQFEGSWISTSKVREGKESIMRHGYASKVDIETLSIDGNEDQTDILYKIEEQRNMQLSAGIAWSGADKLSYQIGADLKNFVGTGKDLSFNFNKSRINETYDLYYADPYFTESGIGMSYGIYKHRSNLGRAKDVFDYALDSYGANIGWRFRISKYNSLKFYMGYDVTHVKTDLSLAPLEVTRFANFHNNDLTFKEFTVGVGWSHNSLNAFIFPSKGFHQSVDIKASTPNSDIEWYRLDYEASWFKEIYDPFVLNLKTNIGYTDMYGSGTYPFYRHYYLGGGDTVRGFEERSLGPRNSTGQIFGGNLMVFGRAQVIFPPPLVKNVETVRMALFLDAGQVYDTNNKLDARGRARNPRGLRYSAGVAVTWYTPMNIPVSASLGWPLKKRLGDSKNVIAISLSTNI